MRKKLLFVCFLVPALTIFAAFFLLPVALLVPQSLDTPEGWSIYGQVLANPRYWSSLVDTVLLSLVVTFAALIIGGMAALFLERNAFPGRDFLVGILILPLSFPGVVVGFMVIMLAGRQGLIGLAANAIFGSRLVFAYSMAGLFAGYLYFSIPRVVTTVMAAAGKLDTTQEEAARTLGASPLRTLVDVTIPALVPALASTGAICFATSIGAFGTAFTLATEINVLPIVIYTEFTLFANFATATMLSVVLGVVTWLILFFSKLLSGFQASVSGI
ncbi:MAG: ABC transporter permease [Deltaproteobacteria bacterium]|jgi:putative spermidine/putrescine transport system permease protein|nr:ABC transporter permease [Deltaproteobacteria bacterium]